MPIGVYPRKPITERFWSHVDKDGPIPEHRPELGPCWVWTISRNHYGYGKLSIGTGWVRAHRYSYELHFGAIPDNLEVCHKCDNPPCVRPGHLFIGTRQDNARDAAVKDRLQFGEHHWNAKLTASDVLTIRQRRVAGESLESIAKDYGIARQTVNKIELRRGWTKLDMGLPVLP